MQQNLLPIKLEKTKSLITPRAGLVLIEKIAKDLNLSQLLDLHFGRLKKRKRGLPIWRQILDAACLLIDGGNRIEDLKQLRHDEAWHRIRNEDSFMAPRTLRDLLYRFTQDDLKRFEKLHRQLSVRIANKTRSEDIATIDVDATFVEANKKESKFSYKNLWGYYPMLGFWAEKGLTIQGEFKQGNEYPGSKALPFLKNCLEALPENKDQKIRLRSDSAWFQSEVMDFCIEDNIEFAIGAKQYENMKQIIDRIRPHLWEPFTDDLEELKQHPERADWQISETVYSFNKCENSYRVVVIRKPERQLEIFKGIIFKYVVVITNMTWEKRNLMKWYWERCTSENWIKELKDGFGLDQFPCSQFLPNGAYFHFVLLAYNLVQALKRIKLDPQWHYLTVKTLRYHLFHIAGLVVRHARQWILKLYSKYPHYKLVSSILSSAAT